MTYKNPIGELLALMIGTHMGDKLRHDKIPGNAMSKILPKSLVEALSSMTEEDWNNIRQEDLKTLIEYTVPVSNLREIVARERKRK